MTESTVLRAEPVRVTRNGKRFFSEARKRMVVEKCLVPGASVAAVALAHSLNANLVRKWIDKHVARAGRCNSAAPLVPVTLTEPSEAEAFSKAPSRPRRRAVATSAPLASGAIEIEIAGARLLLRGVVEARQLELVLRLLRRAR